VNRALAQIAAEVHAGKLSARDAAVTVQALQAMAHSKYLPGPTFSSLHGTTRLVVRRRRAGSTEWVDVEEPNAVEFVIDEPKNGPEDDETAEDRKAKRLDS
jgi:hypothetical protein